jgi:hypothetical protein
MTGIAQIEGPIEMNMDGVGPMEVKDGKVSITRIPPVPLIYGIDGSIKLHKIFGPNMVWGMLNK